MNRRGFLKGLLAGAVAAPGLVAAASKATEPAEATEPVVTSLPEGTSGYHVQLYLEAMNRGLLTKEQAQQMLAWDAFPKPILWPVHVEDEYFDSVYDDAYLEEMRTAS